MARKHETDETKYVTKVIQNSNVSLTDVALLVPKIVLTLDTSMVKQHQIKPDWKLYRVELRNGVPYIIREMCDRCGKVWIAPKFRKLRAYNDKDFGTIYLESGICHDCINASVYVDKYLDGAPLSEAEAKKQFTVYAELYERAWRKVISMAPREALSDTDWKKACAFFNGCAICGATIEVQAKFFPIQFNGTHSAWNVIPMCTACYATHRLGRLGKVKVTKRYRIFSSPSAFQRTKTIRMYLMQQMDLHNIDTQLLLPYRQRFFETKTLEGS